MYVRYKKNIQENDLPRKRVRKASKIAGSGGQYLEIRYPERGRKPTCCSHIEVQIINLEIRYPERGRKQLVVFETLTGLEHLEIRYPERGRKPFSITFSASSTEFGNKIPREGTETAKSNNNVQGTHQFGNKIPREGTETCST